MSTERIAQFVARPDAAGFEVLALEAFSRAYERDPAVRELCRRRGLATGELDDWRSIPAVAPGELGGESETESPESLTQAAIQAAFETACLRGLAAPPLLRLVEKRRGDPTTSHLVERSDRLGGPGSAAAVESGRIDVTAARSWLAGRQRDGRPALIVSDDESLGRLLGMLERQDLRFRLASGSRVIVLEPLESAAVSVGVARIPPDRVGRLGLDAGGLVRQFRWAGVPTPCYGSAEEDGRWRIAPPHWVGLSAVDPAATAAGEIAALDLTRATLPLRVTTGYTGSVEPGGVALVEDPAGRA